MTLNLIITIIIILQILINHVVFIEILILKPCFFSTI